MTAPDADWIAALSTFSSTREKILEHRFVADVTSELWQRGVFDFAVSHSEVDNSGYDVILEANGITRHVQLKAMREGGGTSGFDVQQRLRDKPSGCVILMVHALRSLQITRFRWFGGTPGEPLPDLGERVTRHTRGDRAARPALREVPIARFARIDGVASLVTALFGDEHSLGN